MDQMGAPAYRGIAEAPGGNVVALSERALWERHAELGEPWTRGALVERFLPLARSVARRYENLGEPIEDLNQVASLGLIKAVDRFDTSRGYAFTSSRYRRASASSNAISATAAGRYAPRAACRSCRCGSTARPDC